MAVNTRSRVVTGVPSSQNRSERSVKRDRHARRAVAARLQLHPAILQRRQLRAHHAVVLPSLVERGDRADGKAEDVALDHLGVDVGCRLDGNCDTPMVSWSRPAEAVRGKPASSSANSQRAIMFPGRDAGDQGRSRFTGRDCTRCRRHA